MFTHRVKPSARRAPPLSYYAVGSPREWALLAIAAVDQTAAAVCRQQWQLARARAPAPESRAIATSAGATCAGPWSDRCSSWH